jgi:2,3-bisphosphoglycerate-independent phosphoglycerate mutase
MKKTPFVLVVLDGFGHADVSSDNAIAKAKTPYLNEWMKAYPHTYLSGSGLDVGLPDGQMGNSEVGHMHLGAGRTVYQELTRLDKAIQERTFFSNPVLLEALGKASLTKKKIHILGLLSPGGVHSHERHLSAMVEMAIAEAPGAEGVFVHAFLDGRDVPPKSARDSLRSLSDQLRASGRGRLASMMGRFYAMDRDKRWDRVQKAYQLLTKGQGEFTASDAILGLEAAYDRGETDEFVRPTTLVSSALGESAVIISEGDVVIFMNFRADRARELTHSIVDEHFSFFDEIGSPRGEKIPLGAYVTLTEYEDGLPVSVAYPPQSLRHTLGQVLSEGGFQQLRIAETEKYAHVTFFFNGGIEVPFPGEKRILVPSPKVDTYDLKPEMSAYELTDQLVESILSKQFDVIICNYANPDMVGHTGNFLATVKAIEVVDECIGRVFKALQTVGGVMMITADHGNAEKMYDEATHQPHTAHTSNEVPLILVGQQAEVNVSDGKLSDVAPTILSLLGIAIPKEMTGRVIFSAKE